MKRLDCPYCKAKNFHPDTLMRDIHEHIVECSKKHVDNILRDALAHMRAYMGMRPYLPDPPLSVPPRPWTNRRRTLGGNRRSGEERRKHSKDLWCRVVGPSQILPALKKGEVGYWNPGLYYVYNGHLLKPEERARPNRRRSYGADRRSVEGRRKA